MDGSCPSMSIFGYAILLPRRSAEADLDGLAVGGKPLGCGEC